MTHFLEVCEHGITIRQCRCPGPKQKRIVPCPYPGHESVVDRPKDCDDESVQDRTEIAQLMASAYLRLPYLPEQFVACSRCAAAIPYDDAAMATHDKFHTSVDAVRAHVRRSGPAGPIGGVK